MEKMPSSLTFQNKVQQHVEATFNEPPEVILDNFHLDIRFLLKMDPSYHQGTDPDFKLQIMFGGRFDQKQEANSFRLTFQDFQLLALNQFGALSRAFGNFKHGVLLPYYKKEFSAE